MGIAVNGVDIDDAAIERELVHHQDADNPLKRSVHELVLRTLLLQEAARLGVEGADDEARIDALLEQQLRVPPVDRHVCATYYRYHSQKFRSGTLVEARHILFQVTPTVSLELLRTTAEAVLEALRAAPERFEELARQYSNCPSGALGGSLGQIGRGQTVPEFDALLFRLGPGELAGHLLETRFGLHIVQVLRRVDGQLLPFEAVEGEIAEHLYQANWQRAMHQYLQLLVGRADIAGVELEGATSPLLQ